MSSKHASPEWHRTTNIIRTQVRQAWARGDEVTCWRCGRLIDPEGAGYDVGHIDPNGGEGVANAAPEHRSKTPWCVGNRSHGGRMGARITNAGKGRSTFQPLPWVGRSSFLGTIGTTPASGPTPFSLSEIEYL